MIEGGAYLVDRGNLAPGSLACGVLATVGGLSLLAGFLTPLSGALVGVGGLVTAFAWVPVPATHLLRDGLAIFFIVVVALAIVLLGPGAFSLDSYLFGRREIVIPHDSRGSRSPN